jgi:HemY protein
MVRLVALLLGILALSAGLHWLADRPGLLVIEWQGYKVEETVFKAIVLLALLLAAALFLWSLLRQVWHGPAVIGQFLTRRRQARGLEALSHGMIAVGAGDRTLATRYAILARKTLPNEPMTQMLRAQAAQLIGDRATSRRIYEAMLNAPDTEQLGLRGLFLEAEREGAAEAARQFAERAMRLNPKLGWSADALFELQCKSNDWAGALATLATARKQDIVDKKTAIRRRAVLLSAQAADLEQSDIDRALELALEANNIAPNLVPAATIAGNALASKGHTARAAKVLQRTWKRMPHPDLALAYSFARPGDSPRDRLQRVSELARLKPHSLESPIAVANAAIEARDWDIARQALQPLLDGRLTQRVCTLMARVEGEQHGDTGRVREWLARAVHAPRDPAWTADGVVSETWAPVSPVTGRLDAFEWRVPVELADKTDSAVLLRKIDELVALGTGHESVIEALPDPAAVPGTAQQTPAASPATQLQAKDAAAAGASEAAAVSVAAVAAGSQVEPSNNQQTSAVGGSDDLPPKAASSTAQIVARAQSEERPKQAAAARPPNPVKLAPVPITGDDKSVEANRPQTSKDKGKASARPSVAAVEPTPARNEAKIFVPPRAPDDPGPEPSSTDDGRASLARYPMPLKGEA